MSRNYFLSSYKRGTSLKSQDISGLLRAMKSQLLSPGTFSQICVHDRPFIRGRILHLLGWEVSLLIRPETTFTRMRIVLANRAGYNIV